MSKYLEVIREEAIQQERQRLKKEIEIIFKDLPEKRTWYWDTDKDVTKGVELSNYHIKKYEDTKKKVLALLEGKEGGE